MTQWKTWKEYTYTDHEIDNKLYQEGIGGGSKEWNSRGKFQLVFLQKMGLQPDHTFIDIGCGPIRAGEHFILYLDPKYYIGFDYNKTYIRIAKELVNKSNDLLVKDPELFCVNDFNLSSHTEKQGDFGLAFSVLNHCNYEEVQQFFQNIGKNFHAGGKLYTLNTNTMWYPHWFPTCDFEVTNIFDTVDEFNIDINQYFIGLKQQLTGPNKKFAIEFTKQ